jgi:hypothetical protein
MPAVQFPAWVKEEESLCMMLSVLIDKLKIKGQPDRFCKK